MWVSMVMSSLSKTMETSKLFQGQNLPPAPKPTRQFSTMRAGPWALNDVKLPFLALSHNNINCRWLFAVLLQFCNVSDITCLVGHNHNIAQFACTALLAGIRHQIHTYIYICSAHHDLPFPAFHLFHFSYLSVLLSFPASQLFFCTRLPPVWNSCCSTS